MPLSEQEQRLLEEMERNLYKHEADIVSTAGGPRTVNYTRVALGIALVAAGLAVIVGGVAMQLLAVGLLGFVLSVGGALLALTASKPADPQTQLRSNSKSAPSQGGSQRRSLMDRLSDEWDKRQQE